MFVKHLLYVILFCLNTQRIYAQLSESFSDGNFDAEPEWIVSNTNDWRINEEKALQSNNVIAGSAFWISTHNTKATDTEWSFSLRLDFNPSSVNYIDVYLIASLSDISQPGVTGYFIRIGNSDDEISLYRKDPGNTIQKLIDGKNGVLNNSSNNLRVKVVRDKNGKWYLFYNLTSSGNYLLEGTAVDMTYTNSSWLGLLVKQSTGSFFQKHFFDDIEVKPFIPDEKPPSLITNYYNSDTVITLLFDEPLYGITNTALGLFEINNGIGNPVRIVAEENEIRLSFKKQFSRGVTYRLKIPQTEDIWGNKQTADSIEFMYYPPAVHEVLITEIMADPSPPKGLPEAEWIEIRNCSKRIISLQNWQINDHGGRSKPFPKQILYPDSCLLLTSNIAIKQLQSFGKCLGIDDFPSLNNEADELILTNERGEQIHYIFYNNILQHFHSLL